MIFERETKRIGFQMKNLTLVFQKKMIIQRKIVTSIHHIKEFVYFHLLWESRGFITLMVNYSTLSKAVCKNFWGNWHKIIERNKHKNILNSLFSMKHIFLFKYIQIHFSSVSKSSWTRRYASE